MKKCFVGSDSGLSCSCLRDPQPSTIQDFNYETLQFQEERLNQVPGPVGQRVQAGSWRLHMRGTTSATSCDGVPEKVEPPTTDRRLEGSAGSG